MSEKSKISLSGLEEKERLVKEALADLVREIETLLGAGEPDNTRAQLLAVSTSIQKLTGKGIPIPDELRALKSSLLTRESALEEVAAVRQRLGRELGEMIRRLGLPEVAPEPAPKPPKARKKAPNVDDGKVLDLFDYQQGNG